MTAAAGEAQGCCWPPPADLAAAWTLPPSHLTPQVTGPQDSRAGEGRTQESRRNPRGSPRGRTHTGAQGVWLHRCPSRDTSPILFPCPPSERPQRDLAAPSLRGVQGSLSSDQTTWLQRGGAGPRGKCSPRQRPHTRDPSQAQPPQVASTLTSWGEVLSSGSHWPVKRPEGPRGAGTFPEPSS